VKKKLIFDRPGFERKKKKRKKRSPNGWEDEMAGD
jgi:hypothetical protein